MKVNRSTALIVVDVQKDFCPGGALEVPEGDRVVAVLNQYIQIFTEAGAPIFFTRDWHPADHISFKEQGGEWPPHCVQGTDGAGFHPGLKMPEDADIVSKDDRSDLETYSGFAETDLAPRLRGLGVKTVLIGGLATDYCVKTTVLDAVREGFETYFLKDASRAVEVSPGDSEKAIQEMRAAGARELSLADMEI